MFSFLGHYNFVGIEEFILKHFNLKALFTMFKICLFMNCLQMQTYYSLMWWFTKAAKTRENGHKAEDLNRDFACAMYVHLCNGEWRINKRNGMFLELALKDALTSVKLCMRYVPFSVTLRFSSKELVSLDLRWWWAVMAEDVAQAKVKALVSCPWA